ncbi:cytochrome c [Pseudomonadales bacterium]|nr:cytochrome c [Pseudomonadales bacterium]
MKTLVLTTAVISTFLVGCGKSAQEASEISLVSCQYMKETSLLDSAIRLKEVNVARKELGESRFLGNDEEILLSFNLGMCEELVMNSPAWGLKVKELEEGERLAAEKERLAAEKEWLAGEPERLAAEKERLAAEKLELTRRWSNEELMVLGEEIYGTYCSSCHMDNGEGVPPIFPAIAGSAVAMGPRDDLLNLVINGVAGSAMPAFGIQLDASQLASVVHYQRHSFGNDAGDNTSPVDVVRGNPWGSRSVRSGF